MCFRLVSLLLLLLTAAARGVTGELIHVEQVRALTPEMAKQRLPVRIRGVLTYFDSVSEHAFIQDQTGTVFFRMRDPVRTGAEKLGIGDRIEITGITWSGSFSPSVAGPPADGTDQPGPVRVEKLGEKAAPIPVPVPFDQLKTGRWHDQFVLVRATVRELDARGRSLNMTLSGPDGGSIKAWAPDIDINGIDLPMDQEIVLRAMVAGGGDDQGRLKDARLLIGDASWIIRDEQATRLSFEQPALPLDGLRRYQPPDVRVGRVRIDGTVSLARPGEGFFLTDGRLGAWVGSPQKTSFQIGDVVTAAGYLVENGISDGIVRVLARGTPPAPRVIPADALGNEENNHALVAMEGIVKELVVSPDGNWLRIVTSDGTHVMAGGASQPGIPASGSRVMVVGVVEKGRILLRGAHDLVTLEPAPWLTERRKGALSATSLMVVLLGGLWLVLLKLQVARQLRLIRSQLVHQTLVEERQRLSRELHDSLEQHLAGLHLQLDTLRDRIADAPESVRDLASGAARMLAHCRDEARRSVFELRTQTLQRSGLAAAIVEIAEEANPGGIPCVTAEISGETRRLDPATEFHLLRCAQEAVANSLKHANAREVRIHLEYLELETRLSIIDDGLGFDIARQPAPARPGFGLLHLKERAARIKARLTLDSSPGHGSIVILTLPAA